MEENEVKVGQLVKWIDHGHNGFDLGVVVECQGWCFGSPAARVLWTDGECKVHPLHQLVLVSELAQ